MYVRVQDVFGEFKGQAHRVAVVVVGNVLSPIEQRRVVFAGMRQVPVVEICHAITAVDLDDWSDQGDNVVADTLYIRTFIDSEPVDKIKQGGRRACLR